MTRTCEAEKAHSSGLSIIPPNRDNHSTERPRTPYPFDKNMWRPVNSSTPPSVDKPAKLSAKRRRLQNGEYVDAASMEMNPPLRTEYHRTNLSCNISPTELMTASKSIIDQVNWSDVVLDVVGRERPTFYRNAFEKILRLHVEELLNQGSTDENRQAHHQGEDQRSLSTIKDTEGVASDIFCISSACASDEKSSNPEEQGDDESCVDKVSVNSGSEEFIDENEEEDADEDETVQEDQNEDRNYEDDQISV